MNIREAVEEYRFSVLDHSKATQDWMRKRLVKFADWCEENGVNELEQVRGYRSQEIYRIPESTAKRTQRAASFKLHDTWTCKSNKNVSVLVP